MPDAGRTSERPALKRVLMVLPFQMSARMIVHAPAAAALGAEPGLQVTLLTRDRADAAVLAREAPAVRWRLLPRPFRRDGGDDGETARRWRVLWGDVRVALGFYLHLMLVYRFNTLSGFRGFRDRLRQSRWLRREARKEGMAFDPWLGFPWPRSRALFRWLYRLYYGDWQRHPRVEAIFDDLRPDIVVLGHLQTFFVTPYVLAARARGVPVIGINGSWDQPTTKGPLCPGLAHVLVQSRHVAADLHRFHAVAAGNMTIVGWPQMDLYARVNAFETRLAFLERLGLPAGARYVLVGAYAHRLGAHEPEMCRSLAAYLASGACGDGVVLYIRSHPLDPRWQERLGVLDDPPQVVVEPPQRGDLPHLANLLKHASVLVASAGTINLDAVAVDTPSIAIAWESTDEPFYDRPARRYDMEHYAAVVATGGIRLVRSQSETEAAIAAYLADPGLDAEARARLRAEHLAPLDGRSGERLAGAIAHQVRVAPSPGDVCSSSA